MMGTLGRTLRLASALAVLLGLAGPVAADPADALRSQVERYVRERVPVPPSSIEIPPLDAFAVAWEASGEVQVVLSTARGSFLGNVPITISVFVDGREAKRGVVTTRVRADRKVYLVGRPMRGGALVHRDDLRVEVRDVSDIPSGAVLDPEDIVGHRTTRALGSGLVWQKNHLRVPQLVSRGQIVRLNFRTGALAIEGRGKAREDGRPGDRIRVVNVDSRREIVGTVTATGEVDVAL
ncbi:MAG: flagellar basal body P-ring formation protein FlgA [Myxococcales bacterium]|nr:flagellar basal body P-ring formation protein FlgA [Myxococcales bacterium]